MILGRIGSFIHITLANLSVFSLYCVNLMLLLLACQLFSRLDQEEDQQLHMSVLGVVQRGEKNKNLRTRGCDNHRPALVASILSAAYCTYLQLYLTLLFKFVHPNSPIIAALCNYGAGGYGALATSIWASTLVRTRLNVTNIGLIVDSTSKTLQDGNIELLAFSAWGSTYNLNYHTANSTTRGRMLVASSAYDWYQTRFSQFGSDSVAYEEKVASDSSVFPYLLRLNGDRHCVVLNPVQDMFQVDPRVISAVRYLLGESDEKPSSESLYYKCSNETSPPCEFDADLRDKDELCRSLSFAQWCEKPVHSEM